MMPAILILVAVVGFFIYRMATRSGGKEKTAQVRILHKESREHQPQGKEDDSLHTEFIVRFQIDGREREMLVSRSMFERAREGDEGTLTYKGTVFVDYESANARPW